MADLLIPAGSLPSNLTNLRYKDMGDGTFALVVATTTTTSAQPLPTGASTSALQTTGNTSLANINTKMSSGPSTGATSQSIIPATDAVFNVVGGVAPGIAPATAPISISGIDGAGLKRHIRTDSSGAVGTYSAAARTSISATFDINTSVSSIVDLTTTSIIGFYSSSAWTTAALNIEASYDQVTWFPILDNSGNPVSSWSALVVGAAYAVDTVNMLPWRYIRLRSGTAIAPVLQAAARSFIVVTRPLA